MFRRSVDTIVAVLNNMEQELREVVKRKNEEADYHANLSAVAGKEAIRAERVADRLYGLTE
jgi:hypothetical protein